MKTGFIVEGLGEIEPFGSLFSRIRLECLHELITRPIRADLQPKATIKVIAKSAESAINYLIKNGAQKIIILIDSEGFSCPLELSKQLNTELANRHNGAEFCTVVKNRSIENWLISDPIALLQSPARFDSAIVQSNRFNQSSVDDINDPIALINKAALRRAYHKTQDPKIIMSSLCPKRASKKSRSFRKLLKEIGYKGLATSPSP